MGKAKRPGDTRGIRAIEGSSEMELRWEVGRLLSKRRHFSGDNRRGSNRSKSEKMEINKGGIGQGRGNSRSVPFCKKRLGRGGFGERSREGKAKKNFAAFKKGSTSARNVEQ